MLGTKKAVDLSETFNLLGPGEGESPYVQQVDEINWKLHKLFPDSIITLHPYLRQTNQDTLEDQNAWRKAAVSPCIVVTKANSLKQAASFRPQ